MPPNPSSKQPVAVSKRMEALLASMEKALSESRKQIDCHEAVAECYGEDLSVFASADSGGGEDEARRMLADLVDEKLERLNERVLTEWKAILEKENLSTTLRRIERMIDEFDRREQREKEEEKEDKQSAETSIASIPRPDGVKASDYVVYEAYQIKLSDKARLLAEIANIEEENRSRKQQIKEGEEDIQKNVSEIKQLDEGMARTADVCSLSGVG